jgi:hypothetical protein
MVFPAGPAGVTYHVGFPNVVSADFDCLDGATTFGPLPAASPRGSTLKLSIDLLLPLLRAAVL